MVGLGGGGGRGLIVHYDFSTLALGYADILKKQLVKVKVSISLRTLIIIT